MNLTYEQIRKYFETRLQRPLPARDKIAVQCPFHDDGTPSATVFLNGNGGFNCNGCQAKGNTFQFEMRISGCDLDTARRNIATITGATPDAAGSVGVCTGVYDYPNADRTIAFQKRRYVDPQGRKTFRIFRPEGRSWREGFGEDTRRVLFNLPDLLTANLVFLAEGEKDCETLALLGPWPGRPDLRITATTNFEGAWQPGYAPKWRSEYSPFFTGKPVVVFEDNDAAGKAWADFVCAAIFPYALSVRRIAFPDLPEHGDVTDWLQGHTLEELRKRITSAPLWRPAETAERRRFYVDFAEFATSSAPSVDWLLGGVIQRGDNGFITGPPKGAKSFCAAGLALALATGSSWLGFPVLRPSRVALVSREDNPALTKWRLKHLYDGLELNPAQVSLVERNLYVNSREQTPSLMLDNAAELDELIQATKERETEFILLDVFNVLHTADENDNTEMRLVLNHCRRIQEQTGAALGILHHWHKDVNGSLTSRLRGASAIAGFAEWILGVSLYDEATHVRRLEFESKAASPPEPVYFLIQAEEGKPAWLRRVFPEAKPGPQKVGSMKG